jgi:hypothetical protein
MMPQLEWIVCSSMRRELEELARRGCIPGELRFLDSMLHMDPQRLEHSIEDSLEDRADLQHVLVFGECCPGMYKLEHRSDVIRVDAPNCSNLLLGKKRHQEWTRRGAFFLLPEWAERWREIFEQELGFTEELLSEFMKENHSCLVYLDTGLVPVPLDSLQECARTTGLALFIESVGLDALAETLRESLIRAGGAEERKLGDSP